MGYPQTGNEVFVSFSLSNTMLSGIGKGTITREEVSADYLKALFSKYGVIVSAKPEQRRLLERVNALYDLELEIPNALKIIQLSEKNRRLVVISVQGLRRVNGSLLPEYTPEEFQEATFSFVKYYVQGPPLRRTGGGEREAQTGFEQRDCLAQSRLRYLRPDLPRHPPSSIAAPWGGDGPFF